MRQRLHSLLALALCLLSCTTTSVLATAQHGAVRMNHHKSIRSARSAEIERSPAPEPVAGDTPNLHLRKLRARSSSTCSKRKSPTNSSSTLSSASSSTGSTSCFPALDFNMPSSVPSSTDGWWCDTSDEYAFVGFSYEVTACQSLSQLQQDFANIRNTYNSRYVRLYGTCDNDGFYDDIVTAAWSNTLGVHALIWFGFDGTNQWETRRDTLLSTLISNPKARYVTRVVQFGSEPLYDSVLTPSALTTQVQDAQNKLSGTGIKVTVSELAYGYQKNSDHAQDVLDAVDFINVHMLPFFVDGATTAAASWPILETQSDFFVQNGKGKKMYWDENAWPSQQTSDIQSNTATASVSQAEAYYQLLDSKCTTLKAVTGGGVGWFWHIYSDSMELGYGLLDTAGKPKFSFKPKTSC